MHRQVHSTATAPQAALHERECVPDLSCMPLQYYHRTLDKEEGHKRILLLFLCRSITAGMCLQIALMKVHERLVEAEEGGTGLVTRMLVCHTQAGCIIGK